MSGAARIVIAIDAEQERLAALEATTPVGKGTVSVTELAGGLARNIIPDACALYVGRRTAPDEDIDEVRAVTPGDYALRLPDLEHPEFLVLGRRQAVSGA